MTTEKITGAVFREFRKSLNLTQAEMGEWCGDEYGGYSRRTVQDWESGKADVPPSVRKLVRFSQALGIAVQ
jgi:transcriptional regulator with XRE-family HTH domain